MFRNQYDSDAITYSPQGRLHQVEYASEAIKQGSVTIGLVSKTHAVLVALKRNAEELSSYLKKIIKIDNHIGVSIAGLAPDARVLSNFMRQQAMSCKLIFSRPIPVNRVVERIADKAQIATQEYGKRPYGVGLLVIGHDQKGPHLFEFQPSGIVLEYLSTAIGARSQTAKTYLERTFQDYPNCSRDELVLHGLKALADTLQQGKELTASSVSIAIVGLDQEFTLYDDEQVTPWLEKLRENELSNDNEPSPPGALAEHPNFGSNGQDTMETD